MRGTNIFVNNNIEKPKMTQNNTSSKTVNVNGSVGSIDNHGKIDNLIGSQNKDASSETLKAVASEIDSLLEFFEQNDPSVSKAQQIVKTATNNQPEILDAEIIEQAINSSLTLRQRMGAAGTAAYIETVKTLLPPFGIAYEAYQAFIRNPESN